MSPFAFCARSFSLSHPLTPSLNGHFITTASLSTTKAVKTKKKKVRKRSTTECRKQKQQKIRKHIQK